MLNSTTAIRIQVDLGQTTFPPQLNELSNAKDAIAYVVNSAQELVAKIESISPARAARVEVAFDLPYRPILAGRLRSNDLSAEQVSQIAELVWPMASGNPKQIEGAQAIVLSDSENGLKVLEDTSDDALSKQQASLWEAASVANPASPVQISIVPPDYFLDGMIELDPNLPKWIGGGSARDLLTGFRWISAGFEPSTFGGRVVIQCSNAQMAKRLAQRLPIVLEAGATHLGLSPQVTFQVLELISTSVHEDQVLINWQQQAPELLQLARSALEAGVEPMAESQTREKMRTMILGVHNYESAWRSLPTYATIENEGKSGLSWRVHILPYIEEIELYEKFKLDEPWDSPHNIKLLAEMPNIYKPTLLMDPEQAVEPNCTTFVAPVGANTVFGQDDRMDFGKITDGTSNTVAFVELAPEHAIPWTAPIEYKYDPKDPTQKMAQRNGNTQVVMFDGSWANIPIKQADGVWQAMFSAGGGEAVQPSMK